VFDGAMASTRRLAAILAADVAGYSRLMGADDEGTRELFKARLRELVDPKVREHRGRIVARVSETARPRPPLCYPSGAKRLGTKIDKSRGAALR
jgi:class 3 adenylate cyclase